MNDTPNPLRSFLLQALILLPSFYFAWYATAALTAAPLAALLEPVLQFIWPDTVQGAFALREKVVLSLQVVLAQPPEAVGAEVVTRGKGIMINPLSYSYGIPLFLALAIASDASLGAHLLRVVIGLTILVAGICATVATTLVFALHADPSAEGIRLAADDAFNETLVRYLHFVGFLLLPRALPVVAWALLYRDTVAAIIEQMRRHLRLPAGA